MQSETADANGPQTARSSNIGLLLSAIGYPVRVPQSGLFTTLLVDGLEIVVRDTGRGLRLESRLPGDDSSLPRLAGYAAGRMLRDDAVLSCDAGGAFLWREIPSGADAGTMQSVFESFADSCDWWRARLEEADAGGGASQFPEMVIRP